jgi:hypothetical protein
MYDDEEGSVQMRTKKMASSFVAMFLVIVSTGCAHYSTTGDTTPSENIVNAPIDVVWQKTLEILPQERITLRDVDKANYQIVADKEITIWSWGDEIRIRFFQRGENETVVHLEAGAKAQVIGWGHQERMVKDIFNKIKIASESR